MRDIDTLTTGFHRVQPNWKCLAANTANRLITHDGQHKIRHPIRCDKVHVIVRDNKNVRRDMAANPAVPLRLRAMRHHNRYPVIPDAVNNMLRRLCMPAIKDHDAQAWVASLGDARGQRVQQRPR